MRLRVRFQKLGKVRWTSHRDVARMWERACRRVRLPLAWTGGFSPRPKLSFGLALPTGDESLAEYLDLELVDDAVVDVVALPAVLSDALPEGVDAVAAAAIDARAPSLQEEVAACSWRLHVSGESHDVGDAVARALAAPTLLVERERKGTTSVDDVRPAILELEVSSLGPGETQLDALVATQQRGLRPVELLRAVDPALEAGRVIRINQWIERDGRRHEPLPLVPADAMRREHDVRTRFGVPSGLPAGTHVVGGARTAST
jgi:radical SAM-linked protein